MVETMNKETSHRWWFESHKGSKRSPWLQSALAELDEKTRAMLKLIEEDADSFAQRAEMYYKKRPELISMVEEFYRAHRSLAERFDLVKSDNGSRILTTFGSPFIAVKHHKSEKLMNVIDGTFNSYSEASDDEEYAESEVDDPEQEEVEIHKEKEINEVDDPELANGTQVDKEIKEDKYSEQEDEIQVDEELKKNAVSGEVYDDEIMKLREEVERLKEENNRQKDELIQKDEEKREVIRQLSLSVGMLKDENVKLKNYVARESPKKRSPLEFSKLKGGLLGKLFSASPKPQSLVSSQ